MISRFNSLVYAATPVVSCMKEPSPAPGTKLSHAPAPSNVNSTDGGKHKVGSVNALGVGRTIHAGIITNKTAMGTKRVKSVTAIKSQQPLPQIFSLQVFTMLSLTTEMLLLFRKLLTPHPHAFPICFSQPKSFHLYDLIIVTKDVNRSVASSQLPPRHPIGDSSCLRQYASSLARGRKSPLFSGRWFHQTLQWP